MTQLKKTPRFKITTIPRIVNEKGTTIEWCKGIDGKQVSIYFREKGSMFAQHYHSGADKSKNPERFFLLSGRVRFTFADIDGKNRELVVIEKFQELLIFPNVAHLAEALDDSVFLEYRSTVFDKERDDTYPVLDSFFS